MADKTIFDYLNAIFYKKYIPYDKKACSSYLLSLWLSHDGKLIDIVNTINEYQFLLPDCKIYEYYYYKIPQGKRYLKWIKKEEVDKKKKEKLDEMRAEFMLSKKEMEIYKTFGLTNIKKTDNVKKDVKNASSIFL